MKQSLDLKLGQHLTITPQLQQAIRLLQLSSVELQQEIQEALENNPLLEEREEDITEQKAEVELPELDAKAEGSFNNDDGSDRIKDTDFEMENSHLQQDLATDSDWGDTFDLPIAPTRTNQDGTFPDIDARNSLPITLRDHLLWQMQMTPFSDNDKPIALALIDAVNQDGYLTCKLEEIQQALGQGGEVGIEEIQM